MKKSAFVSLVLVSAALANCHTNKPSQWQRTEDPVYYESPSFDSTHQMDYNSNYQPTDPFLWYYSFQPYGTYYRRRFYGGAHSSVIFGKGKAGIRSGGTPIRGGFGRSMSVAS